MPIVVQHGPISAALSLAQQAGKGDAYWRQYEAEQARAAMDQQRRQFALSMMERERAARMQQSMAYSQMQQRERLAQQQLASQAARAQGSQMYQAGNLAAREAQERRLQEQLSFQKSRAEAKRLEQAREAEQEKAEKQAEQQERARKEAGKALAAAVKSQKGVVDFSEKALAQYVKSYEAEHGGFGPSDGWGSDPAWKKLKAAVDRAGDKYMTAQMEHQNFLSGALSSYGVEAEAPAGTQPQTEQSAGDAVITDPAERDRMLLELIKQAQGRQ